MPRVNKPGPKGRKGELEPLPKPEGRPSDYTPELGMEICRRMAEGDSLRKICEPPPPLPGGSPAPRMFPTVGTVISWVYDLEHPEFSKRYMLAGKIRAELWAEESVEIADTEPDPAKARVRVDTRKWIICKLLPRFRDVVEIALPEEEAGEVEDFESATKVVNGFIGFMAPVQSRRRKE